MCKRTSVVPSNDGLFGVVHLNSNGRKYNIIKSLWIASSSFARDCSMSHDVTVAPLCYSSVGILRSLRWSCGAKSAFSKSRVRIEYMDTASA